MAFYVVVELYGEKFLVFDCVMYGTILDCRRQYEVS